MRNKPKWATPIFVEKTITNGTGSVKFVKLLSLESFLLYGSALISQILNITYRCFSSNKFHGSHTLAFPQLINALSLKWIVKIWEWALRQGSS